MDDNTRAFARNMFRLRVHESDGQAYQNLFVRVMQNAFPTFRPVRAHGQIGDKKNDGYDSSSGTYYQVYAPEDVRKTSGEMIKKLKGDFSGLKAFWDDVYKVRQFFFVVNDKYRGVSPNVEKQLFLIQDQHKLVAAAPLLAKDLESTLFSLKDDIIVSIVGHVPAIEPSDFLFLSGFTYFLGAWIEFERTSRNLAQKSNSKSIPLAGRNLIQVLKEKNVVSQEDRDFLLQLSYKRNQLVHGDTKDIPKKELIDRLVLLTDSLSNH